MYQAKTTLNNTAGDNVERFHVTQKMVPSARLVAYYLHKSELVSNSVWFDVVHQCKEVSNET